MSKKILSVILAIVVMASLCIVSASAAANNVDTSTGALHVGDTVKYTVSLKYGDDLLTKVAAVNGTVTYDANVLEIKSALTDLEFPVLGDAAIFNIGEAGKVLFNGAAGAKGFKGFKDGGALIVITFAVKADATATSINFSTEELFDVTVDAATGNAAEGVDKKDITSGCSATAEVTCPHKTSDSDKNTDTSKASDSDKATDSAKTTDTTSSTTNKNAAPKTGDIATVVMMLVFAAAAVVVIAKKREA